MSQKGWLTMDPLHCATDTAPCLLSDEYVIIASNSSRGKIYSCHLGKDKWFEIGKLGFEPLRHTAMVDSDTQTVYVYSNSNTSNDIFCELNLREQSCVMYKGVIHGLPQGLGTESGGNVQLCRLNNTVHAIGGHSRAHHSIWSGDNRQKIKSFTQKSIGDRPKHQTLYGHALVTLRCLSQILIFGGRDNAIFGGYLREIWVCQTNAKNRDIQWSKLTQTAMPNKMCSFGCVKTEDESHILIFGGKTGTGVKDDIWVLDTHTWKWRKSSVKCPKKSRYYALITSANEIHLFVRGSDKRWRIPLSDILSLDKASVNGHHRSPSNSVTTFEQKNGIKSELCDDKHFEDRIRAISEANNELSVQCVTVTEKFAKLQKEYTELQRECAQNKDWRRKYNVLSRDFEELNAKYSECVRREEFRVLSDVSEYKEWNCEDIIAWIGCLEQGRFRKYATALERNLRMEKMSGEFLTDLDKHDIHRLGVTEYGDKKALLAHFQSLSASEEVQNVWNDSSVFAHVII